MKNFFLVSIIYFALGTANVTAQNIMNLTDHSFESYNKDDWKRFFSDLKNNNSTDQIIISSENFKIDFIKDFIQVGFFLAHMHQNKYYLNRGPTHSDF